VRAAVKIAEQNPANPKASGKAASGVPKASGKAASGVPKASGKAASDVSVSAPRTLTKR
jgi:hypothetical protein